MFMLLFGVQADNAGGSDAEQSINANDDNADESQFMEKMKAQMREKRRKLDASSSSKVVVSSSSSSGAVVAEETSSKQGEQAITAADSSKGFDHEKDAVATLRQAKNDAVKAKAKEYGKHYTATSMLTAVYCMCLFCHLVCYCIPRGSCMQHCQH
jgi:glutamine synthetase adenylyltransferase